MLLADKLRTYGRFFGDDFTVQIPTGSGRWGTLTEAADLIDGGLTALFRAVDGRRPSDGARIEASDDPLWSEQPTFADFDGDTGEGLGATHQTGWTALVAHPRQPPAACRPATPGLGLRPTLVLRQRWARHAGQAAGRGDRRVETRFSGSAPTLRGLSAPHTVPR